MLEKQIRSLQRDQSRLEKKVDMILQQLQRMTTKESVLEKAFNQTVKEFRAEKMRKQNHRESKKRH